MSLAIGRCPGPIIKGSPTPPLINFLELTPEAFKTFAPCCVVAWLFHESHDAFRIARWLVKHEFRGMFYAVCEPLPRSKVVINDMRRAYPELRFELLMKSEAEINTNPYEATLRFYNKTPRTSARHKTKLPLQPA